MKAATTAKVETPETPEISIHAAREGGDVKVTVDDIDCYISIHAAREGGDLTQRHNQRYRRHFNPRRP